MNTKADIAKVELLSGTLLVKYKDIVSKKNVDNYLKYLLKNKYEGKCHNNGYIIVNSLELIQRSIGNIRTIDSESYVSYEINYKIKSIVPCIGDIFECVINSITKMGIIGYLNYGDNTEIEVSPLLFIIPREYIDEETKYGKNDTIKVEVLDTRIKFMSNQIQIIGKKVD